MFMKKNRVISLLITVIFSLSLAITTVLAAPPAGNTSSGTNSTNGVSDYGLNLVKNKGLVEKPAGEIIGNIIQWVLGIVGVLLMVMLIYGGVLYMISGGNEERITMAKKVLTYSIFGVMIIAIAFALTRFIINALLGA